MALSAATLAAAIKTPTKDAYLAVGAADNAALEAFITSLSSAIADAVVTHITSAAVVSITGATVCGAGAGTCTGTGSVT